MKKVTVKRGTGSSVARGQRVAVKNKTERKIQASKRPGGGKGGGGTSGNR